MPDQVIIFNPDKAGACRLLVTKVCNFDNLSHVLIEYCSFGRLGFESF